MLSNILRTANTALLPAIARAPRQVASRSSPGWRRPRLREFRQDLRAAGFGVMQETVDAGWWAVAARAPGMRVLVPRGSAVIGQRTSLDENETHHLKVRRAREHEGVEVLDGAGFTGTGRLVRDGAEWLVEIESAERRPAQPSLTLGVAAGDRERFTWMAEKAVELGVTRIVPLETAHTAGVASRLKSAHLEKLRRVVLEATKQCGAAWAPDVEPPVPLVDFIARANRRSRVAGRCRR